VGKDGGAGSEISSYMEFGTVFSASIGLRKL
jgi:hypothetical protein